MARKLKIMVVVVSVGMLIYLVSSANISVAEDTEIASQEQFADVTISVEATVVRVELEVLEEITGEPANQTLSSIPIDKIMQCIRQEQGGEVVSAVKLAVGNDSVAEMNTERHEHEKRKNTDEGMGEQANIETTVSLRIEALVKNVDMIMIQFDFKQIASETASSSEADAEEQHDTVKKFEVSSGLVLQTGKPKIVSAARNEHVAKFLIMHADI
jgi:hypothetical protein